VGFVAGHAALHLYGQVLEDPGPTLLRMALEAHILIELVPLAKTGSGTGAVWGVAIRALYCPLQDLVAAGQVELAPHLLVAGKAKLSLLGLEQVSRLACRVDLVAVIACNAGELVGASSELEELLLA